MNINLDIQDYPPEVTEGNRGHNFTHLLKYWI